MGHSINSCKEILFMDGNMPRQISEVWYCDNAGNSHKVWPCVAELREVYVVALSTNGQSYDVSSTQYIVGQDHIPNVTLLPGHQYAVKGTVYIYNDNRDRIATITDCYFHYETTEHTDLSGDGLYTTLDNTYVVGNTFGSRTDSNGTSNTEYNYWTCTTDTGTDRGMTMQAYYNTVTYGPVQFNAVYDSNYVTPFVFRRAEITESLVLAKQDISSYNQNQKWDNYPILKYGDTITIYPKSYKQATADGWNNSALTNWEELNSVSVTWDDPDNAFTIVKEGNHYNVTPTIADSQSHELTFWYGNCPPEEMWITAVPQYNYRAYDGNYSVQNTYTLTSAKTFTVKRAEWNEATGNYGEELTYSGAVTTTYDTAGVITVSNNGKTITPITSNPGGQTVVTMSVDGQQIARFTVTVGQLQTVYYKVSEVGTSMLDFTFNPNHGPYELTDSSAEQLTGSGSGTRYFAIDFASNQSMTTGVLAYIDTDGEPSLYGSDDTEVEVLGEGETRIIFQYNRTSGNTFTVNIPVYADVNLQYKLGELTITLQ